jgi:DNA-binding response OmpR family regulator
MMDQLPHLPNLPLLEDDQDLQPVLEAALTDDGFKVFEPQQGQWPSQNWKPIESASKD